MSAHLPEFAKSAPASALTDVTGHSYHLLETKEPAWLRIYDAIGVAVGWTKTFTISDAEKIEHHFDNRFQFVDAEKLTRMEDGTLWTTRFDKDWALTGADVLDDRVSGHVATRHFDSQWQFVGAEDIVSNPDGSVTTLHYDSAWNVTHADVVTERANGAVATYHYDGQWQLLGSDIVVTDEGGSTETNHYDAAWNLTGRDVVAVSGSGIVIEQRYDGDLKPSGADYIGTVGSDKILGDSYANLISGRAGNDVLTGRSGNDGFVFDTNLDRLNIDRISDFTNAPNNDDTIYLSKSVFSDIDAGALRAEDFLSNATGFAADASDRIIYNAVSGDIFYDPDGYGGESGIRFAHLDNYAALSHLDFIIY